MPTLRACELLQLSPVAGRERLGTRPGRAGSRAPGRVLRHLGRHRVMAVRIEAEQRGQFGAQGQNAVDVATVVQGLVAELGRTLRAGAVQDLAQVAVFGPGLHRQVARHLQGQFPAGPAVLLAQRGGLHVFRQALQPRFVLDEQRPCIGGVEHVLRELGRQRRQFLLDRSERCSGASSAPPSRKSRSVLSSTLRRASSKRAASGLAASAWYWRYSARFWPSALAKRVTRGRLLL